jgi:hypothetical protein
MKFSMTVQEKKWPFNTDDCLIKVTTWTGLTVYWFITIELISSYKVVPSTLQLSRHIHCTFIKQSSVLKGHFFSCTVIENFIWTEPLLEGHLSYKATFFFVSKVPSTLQLSRHIHWVISCLRKQWYMVETYFVRYIWSGNRPWFISTVSTGEKKLKSLYYGCVCQFLLSIDKQLISQQ